MDRKNILKKLSIFILITTWFLAGWPRIFNFPPIIQQVQAAAVSTPTFGTNGGSSNNDMSTTISTSTGGASICYTTDGTTPTGANNGTCTHGTLVSSGSTVNITATATVVKAIGVKGPSGTDSSVATSNAFTLTVANPAFGTNGGSFNNDTSSTQTSTTTGAVFCQTVDGTTTPAATSGTCTTGTTGAIATVIATGKTIKVIGTKANYVNSTVQTSSTFTLTVANPSFGTNGGSFNNDTTSTQTSTTTGAVFCQTVDGTTTPAATSGTCTTGTTGANATVIATGKTIKVIGTKANYVNSTVQTSNAFTLTVANPAFGTNGGSFNNDTSSTQTSTTTSTVFCYTLDGATPAATTAGTCDSDGHTQTGATATVIATNTTIKVLGTKANYVNSAVQTSSAFTLTVGAITSSPGAGTYTSTQSVTLNIATTTGATIHYTTDGSAVNCSSTTYPGAFNVSATTTVKAIGCKTNYVSDSAIGDLYTIVVISVSITTSGTVSYGNLPFNTAKSTIDLGSTQTAKNDGNVAEDFTIKTSNATGGTGWTLGSSAGTNIFVHEFSTNSGSVWTKFAAADTYSSTNLATNLAANGTQNFDLRITTPTSSDAVSKSITITILAAQH